MDYVHPISVSFIFPLLVLTLFFESLALYYKRDLTRIYSSVILLICFLITPIAYYSGIDEFNSLNVTDVQKELVSEHHLFAKIYFISILPTFVFGLLRHFSKISALQILFMIFLAFNIALATFCAERGGRLVFEHNIGLKN